MATSSSEFHSLVEMLRSRAEIQAPLSVYQFLTNGDSNEETLTVGTLDEKARAIAATLQSLAASGERALLLYPPGLEYIAAFFGCLFGNIVAVPAYPPDPGRLARTLPRLQAIIRDSQATLVLTTQEIHSMAEFLFSQAPDLASLKWLATDGIPSESSSAWKDPGVSDKTLAFLQYTSGSTGSPKGVMLSHGNLLHNSAMIREKFEHTQKSQGVIWLPPYHDMGLIGGIIQPLYVGFPCVLMSPLHFLQHPLRWLRAISRFKGTTSGGPNFAYELCIRKATPDQLEMLDLSHWDLAFCGAEPIRPETLRRFTETFGPCGFRQEAFYPCYGLAEGTLIVSGGKKKERPILKNFLKEELKNNRVIVAERGDAETWVGCGEELPQQEVRIVNPETMSLKAADEVGEIWVKGPSVALGYWNQSEETEKTFGARLKHAESSPEPFLRTGDLGFLKDGQLFVTGRQKDLIIIRGQNHYPQDLERSVEKAHPLLRPGCGAVFSVEERGEEQLVVVQELDKKEPPSLTEDEALSLVTSIRQAVSVGHELETFAVVLLSKGTIPKTSSGKISRFATRKDFLEGTLEALHHWKKTLKEFSPLRQTPSPKPREEAPKGTALNALRVQNWFIDQLSSRLGLSPSEIDIQKPITNYGLDSKDAINLSGELEDWLGRSFSPTLILKYPTIEQLAHYLSSEPKVPEGAC